MADSAPRFQAIRNIAAQIPTMISKQTQQPKYNPNKVGGPDGNEKDAYGLPKDRNVVYTMSIDNYDKAQKAGIVVERYVWMAIVHIADNMCRLATDEEILDSFRSQREFYEIRDDQERLKGVGRYAHGAGRAPITSDDLATNNSPDFKALKA